MIIEVKDCDAVYFINFEIIENMFKRMGKGYGFHLQKFTVIMNVYATITLVLM